MLKPSYKIPTLPPDADFETLPIMRSLTRGTRLLAELKGRAPVIPNQGLLIDTLSLQEAKDSSEIENIITTHDELFRRDPRLDKGLVGPAKEVAVYRDALKCGFEHLGEAGGILLNRTIIEMFRTLKNRSDGFRQLPGTGLLNEASGEVIYVPPQDAADIEAHMAALERFINDDAACVLDPLIKMAIIHHQFESIHPFPDGNGRLGRMLNVLYLTKVGLLDIPILYMSRGINRTKADYYRLLQAVRDSDDWEAWVVYMLDIIADSSDVTLALLEGIRRQMMAFKAVLRADHPKIYSQDLINNLFRHPYTRVEYVQRELSVSRPTATKYLEQLVASELLLKFSEGRNNYYVNAPLVRLLEDPSVER
ncbi:MAG: Fic family protein [Pseudomonadota bacterium]